MKAPVLAIAFGKKGGYSKSPDEPDADDDGDERDAFEMFADKAGIAAEKRDDAYDALVAMIQACIAREKSGGYDEES